MARGLAFQEGGFYHVYNRGTEKRIIFTSVFDYERFVMLLYLANSTDHIHFQEYRGSTSMDLLERERNETLVDICAYCLMPNHFHLLLHAKNESGISAFMHKLSTGYTMYFNTQYERTGALFQGRYKAEDANDDRYLKYLISYVHLNPIKLIEPKWKEAGLIDLERALKFLDTYSYSSYLDYRGLERPQNRIVTKEALPLYFETPEEFKAELVEWLSFRKPKGIEAQPRSVRG